MALNTNKQNLWCRNKYCQHINTIYGKSIFKESYGCFLKECKTSAEECRGAHSDNSIKVLPAIYKYNNTKKDSIDWVKLYLEIKDSLKKDSSKIINPEHKKNISDLTLYNFIELIQLWRELSCYYRKISKSLPSKKDSGDYDLIDGYDYQENVPKFYLSDNLEDIAWSFERLTRWCPVQQKFNDNINNNVLITIWDVCLATGVNCKEGIHNKNELLCVDDFLTGRCTCSSKEEISEQLIIIEKQLDILKEQDMDSSWTVKKNKKKNDSKQLILSLENKINDLKNSRPIHYTEQNMIPFNEQYKNYLIAEEKKLEELRILEQQKIEEVEIKKPVIKLVKFGKK